MDPPMHSYPLQVFEVKFTAPSTGTYVLAVHFFGWQIQMRLNGPGGSTTAAGSSNTPTAVASLLNATGGTGIGSSISCTGIYLGFVQSIQVYQL